MGYNWTIQLPRRPVRGFVEVLTLSVLALLAGVELADRAVIAHDACPHLAALTLMFLEVVRIEG
jgi:hypothetical protein